MTEENTKENRKVNIYIDSEKKYYIAESGRNNDRLIIYNVNPKHAMGVLLMAQVGYSRN